MIDFRFFTEYHYPYPVAYFHPPEKECVIQSIHKYFLEFFGSSVEYNWKDIGQNLDGKVQHYIPVIPQLRNASFSIDMYFNDEFSDMKNLENFFSSSPVLKAFQMNATRPTELFNPESKFYQTESIEIQQFRHTFPNLLSHFQGKQAFILCGRCEILDLIAFVDKWKSGEGFRNLEYLEMKVVFREVSQNQILNGIGSRYIDASKQPPTHSVPKFFQL
ncbi:hypothetical protein B9Z55_009453 [Caenorhabditis nigoni]|uniref:F-box associated domain-containing protein n=1 Tax=Caenorhabditis nigoni TaxID=1611254 RepID=A0A2G5US09_9PELO|nr:hypothetical protein B9Z55_009453 [Caenorhabditis nigoni]